MLRRHAREAQRLRAAAARVRGGGGGAGEPPGGGVSCPGATPPPSLASGERAAGTACTVRTVVWQWDEMVSRTKETALCIASACRSQLWSEAC